MIKGGYRLIIPLGSGICYAEIIISGSIFRFMGQSMFKRIDCIVITFLVKKGNSFEINNLRVVGLDIQCTIVQDILLLTGLRDWRTAFAFSYRARVHRGLISSALSKERIASS